MLGGSLHGDTDTAVDVQGALERLVSLKTDDGLLVLVDVAGRVSGDARHDLGVHVEDAALLALLLEQAENRVPQVLRALGRTGEEGLVTLVRGVVALDEVANIHLALPITSGKTFPSLLHSDHSPKEGRRNAARAAPYELRTRLRTMAENMRNAHL